MSKLGFLRSAIFSVLWFSGTCQRLTEDQEEYRRLPGSLMKGGIPRNSCQARWRRRKRRLLYPHPNFSLVYKPFSLKQQ